MTSLATSPPNPMWAPTHTVPVGAGATNLSWEYGADRQQAKQTGPDQSTPHALISAFISDIVRFRLVGEVRGHQKGITLFELLIVLAILSLAAGVTAPSLSSVVRASAVKTTAQEIHDTLRRARSSAVFRAQSMGLFYDPAQNIVWTGHHTLDNAEANTLYSRREPSRKRPADTLYQVSKKVGLEFAPLNSPSNADVTFHEDGKAEERTTRAFDPSLPLIAFYADGSSSGGSFLFYPAKRKQDQEARPHLTELRVGLSGKIQFVKEQPQ